MAGSGSRRGIANWGLKIANCKLQRGKRRGGAGGRPEVSAPEDGRAPGPRAGKLMGRAMGSVVNMCLAGTGIAWAPDAPPRYLLESRRFLL